jgi:hypothetical protein
VRVSHTPLSKPQIFDSCDRISLARVRPCFYGFTREAESFAPIIFVVGGTFVFCSAAVAFTFLFE